MQNRSAHCGRGEQQLWGGGRTTRKLSLKPIRVPTPDGCVDRGYEKGRRPLPGSMLFADDIVLCDDDETYMTEYMETWRREA